MQLIPLSKGYEAMVDDEDFDHLSRFKWTAMVGTNTVYAYRKAGAQSPAPRANIRMHRVLFDVPPGYVVDHIDGNGLNNRKSNLRLADLSANNANKVGCTGYASRYKGVFLDRKDSVWCATIGYRKKTFYLGRHTSEEAAARCYDCAALILHGTFAKLNFPDVIYSSSEMQQALDWLERRKRALPAGVYKRKNRFRAVVYRKKPAGGYRQVHLGSFKSSEEAALARQVALGHPMEHSYD
ncbi:MAG: AP2 domain-containing protein [Acetobacteraceae bacterium]